MKKKGVLNSDISAVLSYLGHTDTICIGDAGLPIPDSVQRIDLSVTENLPSFLSVLKAVCDDMHIEKYYLAKECEKNNSTVFNGVQDLLEEIESEEISHSKLKEMTKQCKAVIRTGECSPYANIILQAACRF